MGGKAAPGRGPPSPATAGTVPCGSRLGHDKPLALRENAMPFVRNHRTLPHLEVREGRADPAACAGARRAGCALFLTRPVGPLPLPEVVDRRTGGAEAEWAYGLTKAQAEELLDWLEDHGARGELALLPEGFAVRCPGFRVWEEGGRVLLVRP